MFKAYIHTPLHTVPFYSYDETHQILLQPIRLLGAVVLDSVLHSNLVMQVTSPRGKADNQCPQVILHDIKGEVWCGV